MSLKCKRTQLTINNKLDRIYNKILRRKYAFKETRDCRLFQFEVASRD